MIKKCLAQSILILLASITLFSSCETEKATIEADIVSAKVVKNKKIQIVKKFDVAGLNLVDFFDGEKDSVKFVNVFRFNRDSILNLNDTIEFMNELLDFKSCSLKAPVWYDYENWLHIDTSVLMKEGNSLFVTNGVSNYTVLSEHALFLLECYLQIENDKRKKCIFSQVDSNFANRWHICEKRLNDLLNNNH